MLSGQYFVRVHVFRKYTTSINYILINNFLYGTYECCSAIILHYLFYHTQHKYTLLYYIIEIIYLAKYIIIIKVFVLDVCVFFFTNFNQHAIFILT